MFKLFIDTSQRFVILAVQKNGSFFEEIVSHANQIGSFLSQSVKTLVEKAGIKLQDLNEVVVGVGPGSYTGTRIGVAFAEALAFGLDIKLTKIPSLAFYLIEGKTQIGLKSNFSSFAKFCITGDTYSYSLQDLEKLPEDLFLLDPKSHTPAPNFEVLSKLKSQNQELLYFGLK